MRRCFWCRHAFADSLMDIDHIRPMGAGGRDVSANRVRSCRRCNQSRGRIVAVWRAAILGGPKMQSQKKRNVLLREIDLVKPLQAAWVKIERMRLGWSPSEEMVLDLPAFGQVVPIPYIHERRKPWKARMMIRDYKYGKLEIHRWADDGGMIPDNSRVGKKRTKLKELKEHPMPEKYQYKDDRVGRLLIEAVAALSRDHPFWKNFKGSAGGFDIEMRIDGHEVPFTGALQSLLRNFDECVDRRAKELIRDKMKKLNEVVNELFPEDDGS